MDVQSSLTEMRKYPEMFSHSAIQFIRFDGYISYKTWQNSFTS